jgi:hypothetical protein
VSGLTTAVQKNYSRRRGIPGDVRAQRQTIAADDASLFELNYFRGCQMSPAKTL